MKSRVSWSLLEKSLKKQCSKKNLNEKHRRTERIGILCKEELYFDIEDVIE